MSIKLAICDDATFIREIVKAIAEEHNFQVTIEAKNGEEAVKKVLISKPDVVLMDMVMPKKNGVEAIKEILKSCPDMKIIAFSTLNEESIVLNALQAGARDFLTKPFQIKDLVDAIYSVSKQEV